MRILLDECVDERFRHEFRDHVCQTARFAGLAGLKNGKLLAAAESLGFDVFITVDQSIPYQQNFASGRLGAIILRVPANRLDELKKLATAVLSTLAVISPGQVVHLP